MNRLDFFIDGREWIAEDFDKTSLEISVVAVNHRRQVVHHVASVPGGDFGELIARLICDAPSMRALLLQIHTELSHTTSADADPENWEGYTLHRIEKLLWREENK